MNCPVCSSKQVTPIAYEGQEIDRCRRCRGIWFDQGELLAVVNRLLSENRIDPQTIKEAYREKLFSADALKKGIRRKCPRCRVEMNVHNYSYDSNIIIDKCPSCDGIWTDEGEMRSVAKYIKGNPEITSYAKSLVGISDACRKSGSKKGRIVAVLIGLFYSWIGYTQAGLGGGFSALLSVLPPLAFIFYGENLGGVTGGRFRLTFLAPVITRPSPGGFIVFLGWVYLIFVPIAVYAILTWGV